MQPLMDRYPHIDLCEIGDVECTTPLPQALKQPRYPAWLHYNLLIDVPQGWGCGTKQEIPVTCNEA